jgi:nitrite reductase/ring-hydroxylating ferredoxin subunit
MTAGQLTMPWTRALYVENLPSGRAVCVQLQGQPILLVNVGGHVSAFADRCAHHAWPMSRGHLDGNELVCSLHQWRFDACTGAGTNPEGFSLRAYPVRIAHGDIQVDVEADVDVDE